MLGNQSSGPIPRLSLPTATSESGQRSVSTIHPAICHPEMAEVYLLSFPASVTRKHFENDEKLGRGERADGEKDKEWRERQARDAASATEPRVYLK